MKPRSGLAFVPLALLSTGWVASANAAEINVPADSAAQFTGQGSVVVVMNAGPKPADVTVKCSGSPPNTIETVTIASGAGIQLQVDTSRGCAVSVQGGPINVQY
jgi:hypothetical protein